MQTVRMVEGRPANCMHLTRKEFDANYEILMQNGTSLIELRTYPNGSNSDNRFYPSSIVPFYLVGQLCYGIVIAQGERFLMSDGEFLYIVHEDDGILFSFPIPVVD